MVQFACWTFSFTLSTTPNNVINYVPLRWHPRGGSAVNNSEGFAQYVWPFDNTDWKSFKVAMWSQNANGTIRISRRINGVDVGQELVLTSPPPEPPFVPTIFTDITPSVGVNKGDVLTYRWQDSNRSAGDMWATVWSFMEFPDGLWGF